MTVWDFEKEERLRHSNKMDGFWLLDSDIFPRFQSFQMTLNAKKLVRPPKEPLNPKGAILKGSLIDVSFATRYRF